MPTTQWGRKETIIWPPHSPIYSYGAIFLSIVAAGLLFTCALALRSHRSNSFIFRTISEPEWPG